MNFVKCLGNDDLVATWIYWESVDESNSRLAGDGCKWVDKTFMLCRRDASKVSPTDVRGKRGEVTGPGPIAEVQ